MYMQDFAPAACFVLIRLHFSLLLFIREDRIRGCHRDRDVEEACRNPRQQDFQKGMDQSFGRYRLQRAYGTKGIGALVLRPRVLRSSRRQ